MRSSAAPAARILVSVVAIAAAGCGGVGDDEITGPRRTNRGSDPVAAGPGSEATETPTAGPTQPAPSGTTPPGTTPTGDAGADGAAPPPATNAFTGAPAYVATTGTTSIRGAHNQFANQNPAKQNCITCHDEFFAAGTVYKDAAGTTPAAQVEVRVRSANGNAVRAYTDAVGNFFITNSAASGAGVTLPALVGARDATVVRPMISTISSGACNTAACHAGAQGWVHVP
jgi:hypothetical protein